MTLRFFNLQLAILLAICLTTSSLFAQQPIRSVLDDVDAQSIDDAIDNSSWWDSKTTNPIGIAPVPVDLDINRLLFLTLQNSSQVKVYSEVPLIRETAITEAQAAFDWTRFAETMWNDLNDPVGSSLTVGGTGTRYLNNQWTAEAGLRKRTFSGGQFEVSQQLGWQDTNSNFFIPRNQGTARVVLGFTQPLMRGRGRTYNESLIVLAQIDVATANEEFKRQLQSHLMEVVRGYWALYLERASLSQKVSLYLRTKAIVGQLQARENIDAGPAQLVSARAALDNRRAELIRARAGVKNAETRLRALINAEELDGDVELIPRQSPGFQIVEPNLMSEVETALEHRPEIAAAMQEIRAGAVRLQMSQHEMLPQLNLITRAYAAGLRGNSDIGKAWGDQFTVGQPSYSVGLEYEMPFGRRAVTARLTRRQIEARQLSEQYRTALENVKAEVDVAVRELKTSYQEMLAKFRSLEGARAETETLEARWRRNAGDGNASLNLESLLRAQERLTETEYEFLTAQLTYNLSLLNLNRANGTLLDTEGIAILDAIDQDGIPAKLMDKFDSVQPNQFVDDPTFHNQLRTNQTLSNESISNNRQVVPDSRVVPERDFSNGNARNQNTEYDDSNFAPPEREIYSEELPPRSDLKDAPPAPLGSDRAPLDLEPIR